MEKGKVSVIITTYKATEKLKEAICSVLNQTYSNFELCIVDDNDPNSDSRRFTEKIVRGFSDKRLKYIQHPENKNGAAARNTGLENTDGEYVAFLDDDDLFYPDRLVVCVGELEKQNEYDAVYTDVDLFAGGKLLEVRRASYSGNVWRELLLTEGMLGTGSNIFIKRICLETVSGFDEAFLRYQDIEFMLRILEHHKILAVNQVLVRKNLEVTNIPQYERYRLNKQMIFSKFDYLLAQLSDDERYGYYLAHYKELLNSALDSRKKANIQQAIADLKSIGYTLSWKNYLKIMFYDVFKLYIKLRDRYRILKK